MEQSVNSPNAQSLLAILRSRCKNERDVRNKSRLSRTTIWRIDDNQVGFDPETLGKLVKAINDD
jgi:hypothetical protein